MQILDPAAAYTLLVVVVTAALAAVVLLAGAVTVGLRTARRDRIARRESIPTYYGRLHFAH
jgi:hypothetical protein